MTQSSPLRSAVCCFWQAVWEKPGLQLHCCCWSQAGSGLQAQWQRWWEQPDTKTRMQSHSRGPPRAGRLGSTVAHIYLSVEWTFPLGRRRELYNYTLEMTIFVLRKQDVNLRFKCAQNVILRGVYSQSLFKLEGWKCNTKITYNSYLSLSHAHCQFN